MNEDHASKGTPAEGKVDPAMPGLSQDFTADDVGDPTWTPEKRAHYDKWLAASKARTAELIASEPRTRPKTLTERIEQWEEIDQMCTFVRVENKAPHPARARGIKVIPASQIVAEPVDYVMEPGIRIGGLTLFQGAPKSGKSYFSLFTGLSVSLGRDVGPFKVPKVRRVLYISLEDDASVIKARLQELAGGLGVEIPPTFFVAATSAKIDDGGDGVLADAIWNYKIEFAIVDTLSRIHGSQENDSTEMGRVMATLTDMTKRFKFALALVHHTRKIVGPGDAGGVVDRGRGSGVIAAAAWSIFGWDKVSADDGGWQANISTVSKRGPHRFGMNFMPTEGKVTVSFGEPSQDADSKAASEAMQERVLRAVEKSGEINSEGATLKEIEAVTSIPRSTLQNVLFALEVEKKIGKTKKGKAWSYWRLKLISTELKFD